MKAKIIRLKDIKQKDYGEIKVVDIFNSKKYPQLNIAKIERIEDGKLGYNSKSNIFYFILKGSGNSTIEGKIYRVKQGDTIFIPKGTKYKNSKGLSLLAISYPRFDAKKEVHLE